MEEEYNKVSNKRHAIYKRVEKVLEIAQQAVVDPRKVVEFEVRFESFNELVNLFDSLHLEVISLVDPSKVDEQDEIQTKFDNMQYSVKAIRRGLFKDISSAHSVSRACSPVSSVHSVHSEGRNNIDGENIRGVRENVKLPRIEIQKFDGNIKNWPSFYDMFKTLIHENTKLSDIERFQYLSSYLSKEALSIIKNLPITAENYKIAFEALKDRFQNKRVLLTYYWQSISQAQKVSGESVAPLRNLLSVFSENLAALDQFKQDLWDFTKFNWLLQKIDGSMRTRFEIEFTSTDMPTYKDLFTFLEKLCRALETSVMMASGPQQKRAIVSKQGVVSRDRSAVSLITKTEKSVTCVCCKKNHSVVVCDEFLKLSPHERHELVKSERWCFNCLSSSHSAQKCTSKYNCRVCMKRHHTLLHFPKSPGVQVEEKDPKSETHSESSAVNVMTSTVSVQGTVLFSTAIVSVKDSEGNFQKCRVLLDSASQASFISEACAKKLALPRSSSSIPVQGLNQMSTHAKLGTVITAIRPVTIPEPSFNIEMIIIPVICTKLPSAPIYNRDWHYLKRLPLADPGFGNPGDIDILLGADVFAEILRPGLKRGNKFEPSAINTVFGWVLLGQVQDHSRETVKSFYTEIDTLDATLKSFWELEQIPECVSQSSEDIQCEKKFMNTHSRNHEGRYIVELPFRDPVPTLGESYNVALRRFLLLEKRLAKNPSLHEAYSLFMKDYVEQHHMSLVSHPFENTTKKYYIPHHCVVNSDSPSTKIRVVFDASAKSSNGVSLNDLLLVGPKLQKDIASILLVFRIHKIVFTADIRQMYRQILIADHQRDYQRILWRFSTEQPVQEFRLNTVTYGVSSSPYLAIRCLLQLAKDYEDIYPLASQIVNSFLYVDDIVTGADSVEIASKMKAQLIALFAEARLELRKWASNNSMLLSSVPDTHQQPISLSPNEPGGVKVLGLRWCPLTDCFLYSVVPIERPCTKRNVLSELARIYDPLGLLSPLTLLAKHLMQCLWTQGLGWDELPAPEFRDRWAMYKSQLVCLTALSVPRLLVVNGLITNELHGFADASEIGYAGVVYYRQISKEGDIYVFLVCAKAKVSPLKRVSIPRLELCAAVLLADLIEFVVSTYKPHIPIDKICAWSDSTVALTWIRSSPHKWKTFVANRVSRIQDKVPPSCWNHVKGTENPADCASRGLLPSELLDHPSWWAGPSWLTQPTDTWQPSQVELLIKSNEVECEQRQLVYVTTVESYTWLQTLLNRFSSLAKIQRILLYCQRFIHNVKNKNERKTEAFTALDLSHALVTMVRIVQNEVFCNEKLQIKTDTLCSKPIRKLAPFIDQDDLLRVGGRLRHSNLSYDARHPMLLPRNHRLTELIIEHVHCHNLHPGLRTLQFLLAQQFWILSPRRAINHVLARCYRCFKAKPSVSVPAMGDLPFPRVSQIKCFSHTAVDFAGPVLVTSVRRRGARSVKAYICVFVCLATKAVHLELVSSLSSPAFLAALNRFVARRGRCNDLYSDCGSNFIGANTLLLSYSQEAAEKSGIKWHFNPPSAPHFGGLWESGVRSVKTHLKRVIGVQILTFEEFSTVLAQIEALLNSRPLCSLSSDPNDLSVLTPGHFLTLEPLTAPPAEDVTSLKLNRLSRWQLLHRMHQDFWGRWQIEYLHTLQQRQKWNTSLNMPRVNDLVLIKDDLHPPLHWKTGRILELYSGRDGISRVAKIQTSKGTLDRPLVKLCPLPAQ